MNRDIVIMFERRRLVIVLCFVLFFVSFDGTRCTGSGKKNVK